MGVGWACGGKTGNLTQLRKEKASSVPAPPGSILISGELESVIVKKEKDNSYHKQAWYEE